MRKDAVLRNARAVIEQQERAARDGKEFSQVSIIDAKRCIDAVKIADKLTDDEVAVLRSIRREPNPDFSGCKAMKEKYAISWDELKLISSIV